MGKWYGGDGGIDEDTVGEDSGGGDGVAVGLVGDVQGGGSEGRGAQHERGGDGGHEGWKHVGSGLV